MKTEQNIRIKAGVEGISSYAFNAAIRELKEEDRIEGIQAKGRGNRKLLRLTKKED